MMEMAWLMLAAAAAYLIGSLNGALVVTRFILGDDIRKHGSGNAGSTNMLRTYGAKLTVPVALWDMVKGAGAVLLAQWLAGHTTLDEAALYGRLIGALFVILGHVFPLFFGFRGGKGVITALAVLLMVDWRIALIAFACFIAVVAVWRYISLGSLVAFSVYLGLTVAVYYGSAPRIAMVAVLTALVFFLHRENIRRLATGTENKFGRKKDSAR